MNSLMSRRFAALLTLSSAAILLVSTVGGGTVATDAATGSGVAQGAAGRTVTFSAGYNMIGVPSGTAVNADSVLAFDTAANSYTQIGLGDSLSGGRGYWAYFSANTPVTLPAGSNASITVAASAGKWQLIGNPSGTTPALVTGADEVFAFDAVAGQYMAVTTLQPGQGAWALSQAGGSITIAPGGTAAAPAAAAATQPAPATQPQPVQTMTPPRTAPNPAPYNPYP
jgi:hypothetical protein